MSENAETGPGLAPATFDLGSVRLTKISVGPHNNNAYLVTDVVTGITLLVDAAAEPEKLLDALSGLTLIGVLTTHRHGDHWSALAALVDATGAPTYGHPDDASELPIVPEVLLSHDDELDIGGTTVSLRHVPGHTPGSLVVVVRGSAGPIHLLTGDALFPGGVGNTWGDKDNFDLLLSGVTREIFDVFPDDAVVDPGHGPSTTVGAERPSVPEWAARGW
jgi:glyoxylase-like metal-dependent hydrolase (beta-lactamase superfamily II)